MDFSLLLISCFGLFLLLYFSTPARPAEVSDEMVSRVLAIFPNIPRSEIRELIKENGSVQQTIEHLLNNPYQKKTSKAWEKHIRNPSLKILRQQLIEQNKQKLLKIKKFD